MKMFDLRFTSNICAVISLVVALVATAPALAQPAASLASCKAAHLRSFIGKPVADLQAIRREKARYVCRGCPMTMDYRRDRLTVTYDDRTRRIFELRCV